jgi:hypothetical protein
MCVEAPTRRRSVQVCDHSHTDQLSRMEEYVSAMLVRMFTLDLALRIHP